jgi:hypothetical protein
MKRTMFVLALAVLSCTGCRAVSPYGNAGCCEPVGEECCDPCAQECCNGRGGNLANGGLCPSGADCAVFSRYCGQRCEPGGCGGECAGGCCNLGGGCLCGAGGCGDGYPAGPYDCSACGSPNWGCTGHRHPQGYVTGNECHCGGPGPCHPPGPKFAPCGNGYCCCCCGPPAPGCGGCCCSSGDQHYNFAPGPPVAQTAYPYYTLRGPRDFLLDNPPSIGPF